MVADIDYVTVTSEVLPLGYLAERVVCPTAGAIATFIGTTRDHFEGKRVLRLEVRHFRKKKIGCVHVCVCVCAKPKP